LRPPSSVRARQTGQGQLSCDRFIRPCLPLGAPGSEHHLTPQRHTGSLVPAARQYFSAKSTRFFRGLAGSIEGRVAAGRMPLRKQTKF
jgi:hypothetical protein